MREITVKVTSTAQDKSHHIRDCVLCYVVRGPICDTPDEPTAWTGRQPLPQSLNSDRPIYAVPPRKVPTYLGSKQSA